MRIRLWSISVTWVLLGMLSYAEDKPSSTSLHLNGEYFQSITATTTSLTLKLKSSGQKYFCRRGNGSLKKCEYGEEITVGIGESLTIIGRHENITFGPLPRAIEAHGFEIREEMDRRSIARGMLAERWFMVTSHIKGAKRMTERDLVLLEPTTTAVEEFINKIQSDACGK